MNEYILAGGVLSGVFILIVGIVIGRLMARAEMRVQAVELTGQLNLKNQQLAQAEAMYEEGQVPYLELLDARQDVLIAQENAVDSTISSLLAKVNTYQSFNGQWSYALSSTNR